MNASLPLKMFPAAPGFAQGTDASFWGTIRGLQTVP